MRQTYDLQLTVLVLNISKDVARRPLLVHLLGSPREENLEAPPAGHDGVSRLQLRVQNRGLAYSTAAGKDFLLLVPASSK